MGYIYKISCNKTNNVYIGLTNISIEHRWGAHIYAATTPTHLDYNFPIHRAMRKYGIENFQVEKLEEVDNEQLLKEREKYWISYYDSYNHGYNATLGGDGQCKYNYDDIVNFYLQNNYSILKTCQYFNIYDQVVYSALKSKNIDYKNLGQKTGFSRNNHHIKILLVEKNIVFNKMSDIDKYFNKTAHPNIRRCLNKITKKAYGYHWQEITDEEITGEMVIYE